MTTPLAERVQQRLDTLEINAAEASRRMTEGKSKDALANILLGRTINPRADTLQKLAEALQTTEAWLLHGDGEQLPTIVRPPSNVRPANIDVPSRNTFQQNVPVRGTAAGSLAGAFQIDGVSEYVMRPPGLATAKDVYAIYIVGDSMDPAHPQGELRFVHPGRPPQIGDTVIVTARYTEDGPIEAFIKRLVKRTASRIVCEQFNPKATVEFEKQFVESCHKVMTMNDLFNM